MELLFSRLTFVKVLTFASLWAGSGLAQDESSTPSPKESRQEAKWPSFIPSINGDSNEKVIKCEYPDMKNWMHWGKKRSDWLRYVGRDEPEIREYNIKTDNDKYVPKGITRKVR